MPRVDDEIAHYTTEQGLECILRSKTLWATHWKFLNDYSEMQHGMHIINYRNVEVLKSSIPYREMIGNKQ